MLKSADLSNSPKLSSDSYRAVVALGSNLSSADGDSAEILCKVIKRIGSSEVSILKQSRLVESVYEGDGLKQPNYVNAVILLETAITPLELLHYLQAIEVEFGRSPVPRPSGQARTLDLDIIDYEGVVLDTPELTLPHPRARARNFVMQPLREIAPDYVFADEVAARLDRGSISATTQCRGELCSPSAGECVEAENV